MVWSLRHTVPILLKRFSYIVKIGGGLNISNDFWCSLWALHPPQNEGSVSFSVSWNICKHLSRLIICSSTSVSNSSVERCLVISFEVGSYSSSIIWECHSMAMWHFLSQSYIGMVSFGSITHPLHFSVQLHKEQLYPCLSTILRTNGFSSL